MAQSIAQPVLRTVAFDHREAGTSAERWAASGLIDHVVALDIAELRRLIVIAAHPDDESLGAGGLIAEAAARGVEVTVIVATAGEASHPQSPTHGPAALADIRRTEVRAAVATLSPSAVVRQLDLGDGRLADSVADLVAEIRLVVDGTGDPGGDLPGGRGGAGCWLVAPWEGDRHPDHAAAAQAARQVADTTGCRLLEFPLWAWHWAHPGDGTFVPEMLTALDLSTGARVAKAAALAAHRSQVESLSDAAGNEAIVPVGFRDHFRGPREIYLDSGLSVLAAAPSAPGASSLPGAGSGRTLGAGYFDEFYLGGADPWGFESRWYEERKRAIAMACLPRRRFASAFEPGCAIGVLTELLAPRCDRLLATDIAQAPLVRARERLASHTGVRFEQRRVPQDWPAGPFDLVVLSEIGYYCNPADLSLLIAAAAESLSADGVLLACHWRHAVADYPMSGDEVHQQLRRESGLAVLVEHVEEDFRLEVLVRSPAESVARRDGLLP